MENILVIDDTPANLEILIRLFQKEGYKVRAVPGGVMGLRAAENEPPDIVLLDVNMPEMSGYDVCRAMKQTEKLRNIPVIFISALTETFDKVTAFEAGGVDYITKPIQFQESLARVRTHLTLRRYQRMLEERNTELSEALTQLKEAQSQLVNSEKMASLGVLTAGVAHEINNPISFIQTSSIGLKNNIRFFLDLQQRYEAVMAGLDQNALAALQEYKSEHEFSDRLEELTLLTENILTGATRISNIVRSLRLFSRLDETDSKCIDIHENIDSTLLLLQPRMHNRFNIIREYGQIDLVPCFPAKISQVFMNIISNAIDAIEAKPRSEGEDFIRIRTGNTEINRNRYVTIEIEDTGEGIPETLLKKIFDPFFTTKPVGKGLGLGLSISTNIIREHGGQIEAGNMTPSGAFFRIVLPVNCISNGRA